MEEHRPHRAAAPGRDIAVRIGALLLIGGACLAALATVWPHPDDLDVAGYLGLAAVLIVTASGLVAMPRQWQRRNWVPFVIALIGVGTISLALYWNGERVGGPPVFNEFFYVWPALYIGYFFSRVEAIVLLAITGLAYLGTLIAIGIPSEEMPARVIVVVSVIVGAAAVMHTLRSHVDRLISQMRAAARTDPLTLLLNRRGFDERFELELERSRRTGAPVALLIGDLDHFKELNDRLGHPVGDTTLALIGQTMTLTSRSIDTVARLGGEEFALLLPDTDAGGGVEAAERLRAEVARVGDEVATTISFGVVESPAHGDSPAELLSAADAAMYVAKSEGGDRTVLGGSRVGNGDGEQIRPAG